MADEVEEIKSRIDIADFIGQYVPLKKAGRNFKAPCPFHQEKDPSFIVSPEKQIFKCFGCQKSGDVFGFLMEYEGIDFVDALKILAEKAGVQLKPRDPKLKKIKDTLYEINSFAAKFFTYVLTKQKVGQDVLEYLEKKRGLVKKTIKNFNLGYAPDNWDILSRFLEKRGYDQADILKSGLVIPRGKQGFYDRFRNRIMFPISDIAQNTVGFSGRLFDQKEMATQGQAVEPAKYINSPDTQIYNKSKILYALDQAKKAIREKNQVIIVEGQMDVLACHQAGFENVIASSGTAITQVQLEILKRISPHFSFAFDADKAGEEATKRAIGVAHQVGILPKIIITPQGLDPADTIKKDPQIFIKAVKNARPAIDFYFNNVIKKYPKILSSQDKQDISSELLPIIKEIVEPVLIGDYINKLAKMIGIEEKYLYEALGKTRSPFRLNYPKKNTAASVPIKKIQKDLIEQRVVGLALNYPQYYPQIQKKIKTSDFQNRENIKIAKALQKSYTKNKQLNMKKFKALLAPEEQKLADEYQLEAENELNQASENTIQDEIVITCQRLKSKRLERIKQDFQEKIAQAESDGDRKKIKNLISKLQAQIGE